MCHNKQDRPIIRELYYFISLITYFSFFKPMILYNVFQDSRYKILASKDLPIFSSQVYPLFCPKIEKRLPCRNFLHSQGSLFCICDRMNLKAFSSVLIQKSLFFYSESTLMVMMWVAQFFVNYVCLSLSINRVCQGEKSPKKEKARLGPRGFQIPY